MNRIISQPSVNWFCKHTWKKSAINTLWCLFGCSLGDNATILFFQSHAHSVPMAVVMLLACLAGLTTSIVLETFILSRKQLPFRQAIKIAFGMSFISMIMMETASNIMSLLLAGGDRLMITWWSLIPSLIVGFLAAWPYNYYNLKKHGKGCH